MEMQKCLYKLLLILALLTPFSLVGCGPQEKGPSIPPVNTHPVEAITFVIDIESVQAGEAYRLDGIRVLYTTPIPGCGFMDYTAAIGGKYRRPEADVDFPSEANKATIYRDYFKPREICPFIIGQIIVHVDDENGTRTFINLNEFIDPLNRGLYLSARCVTHRAVK